MNDPVAPLVDSHCHLDVEQFDADRAAVVERARSAGLRLIVNPGIDLQHCRQAIALSEQYPEVYAAVGIHPNSSADFSAATLAEVRRLAQHPKVVAIGEIGLDYYWQQAPAAQQAYAFRAQLELAAELGLPVIIHNRDATEDTVAMLDAWVNANSTRQSPLAPRPFWGVLHAFGGDRALAQQAFDWHFAVGLGGPITFRNAQRLQEVVAQLPLDHCMIETDAPYLTPHPYRGKRNEPAHVALVCEQIAHLQGQSRITVAQATTAVAYRFFGLSSMNFA
ncbi:MAG: TatD family deoxyribonuclease [Caldilinea sp. CFX5]|nr:TatD family deoxyribonuclease [Caldilinea sp. CFX5]